MRLVVQSAELTVSSFSRAGMDSSLAAQEGSDQPWSSVISNSSAALRRKVQNKLKPYVPLDFVEQLNKFCFVLN